MASVHKRKNTPITASTVLIAPAFLINQITWEKSIVDLELKDTS